MNISNKKIILLVFSHFCLFSSYEGKKGSLKNIEPQDSKKLSLKDYFNPDIRDNMNKVISYEDSNKKFEITGGNADTVCSFTLMQRGKGGESMCCNCFCLVGRLCLGLFKNNTIDCQKKHKA